MSFFTSIVDKPIQSLNCCGLERFLTNVFKRIYWVFTDFFFPKKDKYFGWAHYKFFYF